MTIDATSPLGTALVSSLDDYIREDRAQINLLWAAITAANSTETTHVMGLGEFAMAVGTDLEDVILEAIALTAAGAVDLMQITGGSGGMIKVIKAGDGNVTVKHNTSYIALDGATDLTLASGNILGLINIGGDPDTSVNGVWYELFRATGSGSGNATYTAVNMAAGQTALVTGTDINNVRIEVIGLTADAAVNLTTMTLGEAGCIKHIIALDDDITVVNNTASTSGGTFYLNAPTGVNLAMSTRDVLSVTNIGGDGSLVHGYWLELNRKLQV